MMYTFAASITTHLNVQHVCTSCDSGFLKLRTLSPDHLTVNFCSFISLSGNSPMINERILLENDTLE